MTVHDTESITVSDLGANFYFSADDVGKNRAEACMTKIADLNQAVALSCHTAPLDREFLSSFNVLVMCSGQSMAQRLEISNLCHELGVCIVIAEVCGLAGMVFADFGPSFIVTDKDGEAEKSSMVACIDQALAQLSLH